MFPHSLLTAAAKKRAAAGDPSFAYVASLLHFDTGNTTITDVKGLSWTVAGQASANGTAKYGANSLSLDGIDDHISTTAMPQLGTSDFTIEGWVKPTTITPASIRIIFDNRTGNSENNNGAVAWLTTDSKLFIGYTASGFTGANLFNSGAWNHVAFTRQSGVFRSFLNGTLQGSQTPSSKNINHGNMRIGAGFDTGAYNWNGQIDDFRVTNGVARYAGNFAIPTEAYPDF